VLADWLVGGPASRANYEQIRVGMPLRKAEEIVGETAGGWWQGPPSLPASAATGWVSVKTQTNRGPSALCEEVQSEGTPILSDKGNSLESWTNRTHKIDVLLDRKGIILGKAYFCDTETSVARRAFDKTPFWCVGLAEAVGLVILGYLCWTWLTKPRRHLQVYATSAADPDFLGRTSEAAQ
jgi:hypothetical protein